MPSIEIVCVGQEEPSDASDYPFAVDASTSLVSHRGPKPLFQEDFDELIGCMYHLGNPDCCEPDYEGPFFAYELIRDEEPRAVRLQFAPEFQESIMGLLLRLLSESSEGRIFFTTDWQAGPGRPRRFGQIPWSQFVEMHDAGTLRLNAAYMIEADRS